jgi:hypothetical protein
VRVEANFSLQAFSDSLEDLIVRNPFPRSSPTHSSDLPIPLIIIYFCFEQILRCIHLQINMKHTSSGPDFFVSLLILVVFNIAIACYWFV